MWVVQKAPEALFEPPTSPFIETLQGLSNSGCQIIYAHPQVVGQHLAVGADFNIGGTPDSGVEHTGVDEANIGAFAVFALVIGRGAGNFGSQIGLGIIIKPQHSCFHRNLRSFPD
jgi:hypothetical protein